MKLCPQQDVLQAYQDRELTRELRDGVTAHLAACAPCAARLREAELGCIAIDEAITSSLAGMTPTARLGMRIESALAKRSTSRLALTSLLNWKLAALTAGIFALLLPAILRLTSEAPHEARVDTTTPVGASGSDVMPPKQMEPFGERVIARRPEKSRKRVPRRVSANNSGEAEVATRFYSLVEDDELATLESGRVVRVEVPASTLISFGLPITAEALTKAVQADLILGQDGLARAIRFVPSQTTKTH
ncbi:MAG: zf-HC2 domain-containing protein [Acidobacteriota bacterium]